MLDTMDLQMAIIVHLNWKSKLSDFFYGVEDLNAADIPDHTTCDFGKWLYSQGMEEFSAFTIDMNRLEALHKEVHKSINHLIALPKERRMSAEGKEVLAAFKGKCDNLVQLMEKIKAMAEKKKVQS